MMQQIKHSEKEPMSFYLSKLLQIETSLKWSHFLWGQSDRLGYIKCRKNVQTKSRNPYNFKIKMKYWDKQGFKLEEQTFLKTSPAHIGRMMK